MVARGRPCALCRRGRSRWWLAESRYLAEDAAERDADRICAARSR
jgi:hypothetical protein